MTYPSSDVSRTNLDAGTDLPQLARADLDDLVVKFNLLRNFITVFARTLLDDVDAATMRSTLGVPASGTVLPLTGGTIAGDLVINDDLTVGGGTNPNSRNVMVNGRGVGAGTYIGVADPSSTANEVLFGFDATVSRSRIQSSDYPLDEWIGGQLQGTIDTAGVRSSLPEGGATPLPLFGVRAWANLNGTGAPAYRARGNFTSTITDHGGGEYSFAFTTAMPDANYSVVAMSSRSGTSAPNVGIVSMTTVGFRLKAADPSGVGTDADTICLVVVR